MPDPTPTGGQPEGSVSIAPPVGPPPEAGAPPEPTVPGALSPEALAAVQEERQRAQKYRDIASQAYVFDDQGQLVGIRQEFADQVIAQYGQPAEPARPDAEARLEKVVEAFASQYGMLPDQVRGIIQLVNSMVQEQTREVTAPLYESNLDQMKTNLIASGVIPQAASPYIDRWIGEALRANPRAAATQTGRETILRQAVGEYALGLLRRRAATSATPANPANISPTLLRPTPGGVAPVVSLDEQAVRQKLGLPAAYTANTPTEG